MTRRLSSENPDAVRESFDSHVNQTRDRRPSFGRFANRAGSDASAGPKPTSPRLMFNFQNSRRRSRAFSRSSGRNAVWDDIRSVFSGKSEQAHSETQDRGSLRARSFNADDSGVESEADPDEAGEDVCFPLHHGNDSDGESGIKLSELDNILNLTSENESTISTSHRFDDRKNSLRLSGSSLEGCSSAAVEFDKVDMKRCEKPKLDLMSPHTLYVRSKGRDTYSPGDPPYFELPPPHDAGYESIYPKSECAVAETNHRFSFFSLKGESTIHAPDLRSLVDEGQSFKTLFNKENGVWWLDCFCPTDSEMKILCRAFGIHPLTQEDISTQEAGEKLEMFKSYFFVAYHTFANDRTKEGYLDPINFYIIIFPEGVLSFHFSSVPHCRNVRRRMRLLRDYVTIDSAWICYALIDDITDTFAPIIHEIEAQCDELGETVIECQTQDGQTMSDTLRRLGSCRRTTMIILRLLNGKADVLKKMINRCSERWDVDRSSEMNLYLGDIHDHLVTMHQNLIAYEKIFSRTQINYVGQLQTEFVNSNYRMTSLLGKATLIGTVLIPMNLITGLFGMNVKVPGQDGSNLGWFFGILGFIIMLIVVLSTFASMWIRCLERQTTR